MSHTFCFTVCHLFYWNSNQKMLHHKINNLFRLDAPFRDVRKFKDTKKQFDRVREDMELAQVKNAQAPRNKVHEAEEATQTLILSRKAFRHLALDYVLQVKQNVDPFILPVLSSRWCR